MLLYLNVISNRNQILIWGQKTKIDLLPNRPNMLAATDLSEWLEIRRFIQNAMLVRDGIKQRC